MNFTFVLANASPIPTTNPPQLIELQKVFISSPLIYSLLLMMSVAALAIWIYSLVTFRPKEIMPSAFRSEIRSLLVSEKYDQAEKLCGKTPSVLSALIQTGLTTRRLGAQVMLDSMKSEGKRATAPFWQRVSLLGDIAVVAPMLGLLGTVIGMFYAFYDVNRSIESINALFDGLGIAVGTTVMGLIVAIVSMIFATTLKYRFVQTLSLVENEALSLGALINPTDR
jgi:biopolymer transport protein ExbB